MASEALYERVLALVEPQELHRSCNDVLKEEYDSLRQVVDGVAAAFAKVEEVRNAVKQLEHGKPSAGRSESLMKTMDSTMEVHKELKKMLFMVAAGMKVQAEVKADNEEKTKEKKRKRGSEMPLDENKKQQRKDRAGSLSSATCSSSSSSSSSSSTSDDGMGEEEAEDKSTHKQAKVESQKVALNKEADASSIERKHAEKTASLQLAQECLETVLLLKGATEIPVGMKDSWSKALDGIKKILKEKSSCEAILTDDAAVKKTIRALHCIAAAASTLEWTPVLAAEVESLITAMTDAWSRNKTLYIHSARKKMKRVRRLTQQLRAYHTLADGVAFLPERERSERIVESLSLMQQIMVNNGGKIRDEVQKAVEQVRYWASELPLDENLRRSYDVFANNAGSYIKRKLGAKESALRRLAGSIPSLVHERLAAQGTCYSS